MVGEGAPEIERDLGFHLLKKIIQTEKLLKSPIVLLLALRVFFHLPAPFGLVDDLVSQGCSKPAEISGGTEK